MIQTEGISAETADSAHRWRSSLWSLLFAALLFLMLCLAWDRILLNGGRDFWDARVYVRALHTFIEGGDPYSTRDSGLPFVYPPFFLSVEAALHSVLHGALAWTLYLSVLIAAILATPLLL